PSRSGDELAKTGSSATTAALGGGAAALIAAGAGTLYAVRRRANG
ncbi:LPXTG cell wall anchor domain-containing protein, partial [Streptomyces sp. SID7760]|nr:LPXTG cell wall anchor domain-containing protein [Streptomyces sp. SID7760]